tara:strand:- start:5239 stop:5595 length:357 start_codon:yes stop_codon:yes gene_type:complete
MKASIYLKSHDVYEKYEEIHGDYSGGVLCGVAKLVLDICIKNSKGKRAVYDDSLVIKYIGIYNKLDGTYVLRYPEKRGRDTIIYPVDSDPSDGIYEFIIEKYIKHKKRFDLSRDLNDA